MKKKPVNEDSDEFDADEPEEFDESGSDWDPEEEPKKRKGRAKAPPKKATPNKRKKVEKPPSEDEEDEEVEDEEEEEEDEEGEESEESEDAPGSGSFVVLKTDFKSGGNFPLWKIDGKALLQKFVPHEVDGKTVYKNTSTYSGWTQNNRNQYAAAPVKFLVQSKKEVVIEFLKDKVQLDDKEEKDKGKEKEEKGDAAAAAATADA